jgi:DNA repair protein RadD
MLRLHDFQKQMKAGLYASWNAGSRATILVAPTGAGKTVIMSSVSADVTEPMCLIAHRQELIQQISMALGRMELPHRIIAPDATIKVIINQHISEFGKTYVTGRSHLAVAGINTLISRADKLKQWTNTVKYWAGDECHHFLQDNMWGTGVAMFPNALGVGFTASPIRCDRKSLHREQGGCFDHMVVGPSMRELIDQGFLADYRIFGPPQSIPDADLKVSTSTGDFTQPSLRKAAEKSTITGDIVRHYLDIAGGARGITFVVDVESANKTAQAFRDAGVPAEAVSAKTPDTTRNEIIRKFERGVIKQLVNVDLFGEGFDVPAVEVVSMGRPTQSFGLYLQQFGRALRRSEGKSHGIVIDHVGNVKRHGLPDAVRNWSLLSDKRGRKVIRDPDVMPVTTCVICFQAYEAVTKTCPHCGHTQEPESRSKPEFVDGDLIEFSPELLAQLRASAVDVETEVFHVPNAIKGTPAEGRAVRQFGEKQLAQKQLREAIALWAGVRRDRGMDDSEIYRRFYHTFGIDVLSAQGLNKASAEELKSKIERMWWS